MNTMHTKKKLVALLKKQFPKASPEALEAEADARMGLVETGPTEEAVVEETVVAPTAEEEIAAVLSQDDDDQFSLPLSVD